jgi:amidohydrolase
VTLPGFYSGVPEIPEDIAEQWRNLEFDEAQWLADVGLTKVGGEKGKGVMEQIWARPTCDVNGIVGGYTGPGAKTVIAAQASAKVSFRLVERQNPDKIRDAWRAFARARVPDDCRIEFEGHSGAPATALDWGMKPLAATRKALTEEWGKPALLIGSGGSIPVVGDFKRTLGLDTLLVGFGLADNQIHSPNEKYDITSFHKGTRSWVRILAALADAGA